MYKINHLSPISICAGFSIGIDIGGTNTDAVLVDKNKNILAHCKHPTENPLEESVKKSILNLLKMSPTACQSIQGIYLGTTHATNALLEAKGLLKVGVLRLAGQKTNLLDPCFKWPKHIYQAVFSGSISVNGGLRCDRKMMTPLSEKEIKTALEVLLKAKMESLAIVGVFSPLSPCQEQQAATWSRRFLGKDFPITVSSEMGGMGFVERENATVLNASLKDVITRAFQNMEKIKHELGIAAPFYITQNDGSIIHIDQAIEKPLLTISSGPTNSFIGGVKLAALQEAIIVDIGGTSADIGIVLNGYPRRSLGQAMIGGIPLNFRMPDVLSLPIGGGSLIRKDKTTFTIGPDSLGSQLFRQSCAFGGKTLTLTDAAYKIALITGSSYQETIPLNHREAEKIVALAISKIQNAINIMRGNKQHLPIVAVGGGAFFLKNIADIIPVNAAVANAFGASLAEITHTVETVISLNERAEALSKVCDEAIQGAALKGAEDSSLRIVDLQVIPYHYIPGNLGRVIATASGQNRRS